MHPSGIEDPLGVDHALPLFTRQGRRLEGNRHATRGHATHQVLRIPGRGQRQCEKAEPRIAFALEGAEG
jgi:hypothetical protein